MKIYIDHGTFTDWKGTPHGIQRVIASIGDEIKKLHKETESIIFDENLSCFNFDVKKRLLINKITPEDGGIIFKAGSDWDKPDYEEQLNFCKKFNLRIVPFFHDIIPMILPYSYGPGFYPIYEKWFKDTLLVSDLAFSNSQNTKTDIIKYSNEQKLKCPEIFPIRLGDNEFSFNNSFPENFPFEKGTPFLLSVGTVEYRKNHAFLLNLYRYIKDLDLYEMPKLIIVGKTGWLDQNIKHQISNDHRLFNKIKILEGISDEELSYLYQNCLFTLYPSLYEGWGLPIAESLNFNKPCIASSNSSMNEISSLVDYCDPFNIKQWSEKIKSYVENPSLREKKCEEIKLNYKTTIWSETANCIFNTLLKFYPELSKKL